jgi:hypothetical protein
MNSILEGTPGLVRFCTLKQIGKYRSQTFAFCGVSKAMLSPWAVGSMYVTELWGRTIVTLQSFSLTVFPSKM